MKNKTKIQAKIQAGDKIKIFVDGKIYEGILIPGDKKFLVLKLASGYNLGFERRRIKKIELIAKRFAKPKVLAEEKFVPNLPTITILHTGGTIASAVDYETGGVIARFSPQELIQMFPEVKEIANIKSRLIANMFSEDMRIAHYNLLAKEILKEIDAGVDGVIVTHGTDTLHYTAAALSFAFQNLPIPIILVGAQRSSDRGSSDAAMNLICALNFIAKTNFAGVAICMHASSSDEASYILPATKTRKMHSCRRDAFKAINASPIAKVNYTTREIEFLIRDWPKKSEKKPKFFPFNEKIKVGLIKCHPNMFVEQFKTYEKFDGLVIEGFGLGHAPINEIDAFTKEHAKIAQEIKKLAKKIPVVVTSQTINGPINMEVYSTGRKLISFGVLGNYCDLTPETAFIKLAWLLSNFPKSQIPKLFKKNFVGELAEQQRYDYY